MRWITTLASPTALAALTALAAACANDPVYLPGAMALEAGGADANGEPIVAKAQHVLPIRLEKTKEAEERAMRTAELGVEVPYVKVGDIEVSVEWTITNTATMPGTAVVQLNGANEAFAYDPDLIVLGDPDEVPPAPGLEGDIPLHVEPGASIRGLFREDQVREASIDLDQITRANLHPFAATLAVHKNLTSFQPMTALMPGVEDYVQMPTGDPIPREAFRQMIRVDLVFKADQPMVLEYTIRVRDVRGIMHELLDAAVTEAPGELTAFAPADFTVTFTP
ncbi:MAG TPA: hypothetical protein VNO30_10865 [Kofleriaceae bacterium]|nr:hypothetical protein [Kofleriaceae bacterium]